MINGKLKIMSREEKDVLLEQLLSQQSDLATDRVITNSVSMPEADIEYPVFLPAGVKGFILHCRDATAIRISHILGAVAEKSPPYFTLKSNTAFAVDNIDLPNGQILFVACSTAAKFIETIAWR